MAPDRFRALRLLTNYGSDLRLLCGAGDGNRTPTISLGTLWHGTATTCVLADLRVYFPTDRETVIVHGGSSVRTRSGHARAGSQLRRYSGSWELRRDRPHVAGDSPRPVRA